MVRGVVSMPDSALGANVAVTGLVKALGLKVVAHTGPLADTLLPGRLGPRGSPDSVLGTR